MVIPRSERPHLKQTCCLLLVWDRGDGNGVLALENFTSPAGDGVGLCSSLPQRQPKAGRGQGGMSMSEAWTLRIDCGLICSPLYHGGAVADHWLLSSGTKSSIPMHLHTLSCACCLLMCCWTLTVGERLKL